MYLNNLNDNVSNNHAYLGTLVYLCAIYEITLNVRKNCIHVFFNKGSGKSVLLKTISFRYARIDGF